MRERISTIFCHTAAKVFCSVGCGVGVMAPPPPPDGVGVGVGVGVDSTVAVKVFDAFELWLDHHTATLKM